MKVLIGKALFMVARACRLLSHVIGALTAFALIASPFVASSFGAWVVTALVVIAIAFGAWLILYVGFPAVLARAAITILPNERMDYAATQLAIWNHEARHGPADAAMRHALEQRQSERGT